MKKGLGLLLITAGVGFAVFASANANKSYSVVYAEDEASEQTSVEDTATDETTETEENWFKKQWDTLVVPVLGGTMGVSLVAGILSVGITLVKNNSLDKKLLELQKKSDEVQEKAQQKYLEAQEKLIQVSEILSAVHTIYETVLKSGELNAEIKQVVVNKLGEISAKVNESAKKITKIDDLIKVNSLLVELEGKVAKQSKEIIKSGIAQDIEQIVNLVKSI